MATVDNVTLKAVPGEKIIFRNFEGKATPYNNAGDRNFCVILDEDLATQLEAKGFNIKWTKGGDDYPSVPYIKIKLGYTYKDGQDNPYPPRIFKIQQSTGMRSLSKETVKYLDGARIITADLQFNCRPYEDRKTHEIRYTAYLDLLYATVEESELEREYNEKYGNMDSQDPNSVPF